MGTAMTIGRASREAGVSPKAIRLYERIGLLPEAERTATGYRLFDAESVATLRFIGRARRLGLHLDRIGEILDAAQDARPPCQKVNRLIDERIADIDHTVAELTCMRSALVAAKADTGEHDSACICPIIEHTAEREAT